MPGFPVTAIRCFLVLAMAMVLGGASGASGMERVVLHSEVLGEDRPLNIILPVAYAPEKTYPVIYFLDGGASYLQSSADSMQAAHPDLIVVGIENVDRSRDMFPDPMPERDNRGGGGEKFLAFITSELVPHIEKNYPADGFRILSGQSNSGFFVLYAMLNVSYEFDAYLAFSPMIGWDWDMIRQGSRDLLEGRKSFSKVLFMNRGETDLDNTIDFLPGYVDLLEEIAPPGFRWKSEVAPGEGHVPESGYGRGIAFIFDQ